jgi:hypothetical protein
MTMTLTAQAVIVLAALTTAATAEPRAPRIATRVGWAYGLGGELEVRPARVGVIASGGYVPGYGAGGYLGVAWGQRRLDRPGFVAEAGGFRGVHNPLRVAATGLGAYALIGYAAPLPARFGVRAVLGGGVPLDDPDHRGSGEFLAKLTVGVTW